MPLRQRGEAEIQFYSFFNLELRWRWVVNTTRWPLYSRERASVPIVQEGGLASGTVWAGVENLVPTGVQTPKFQARNESLYRLSYPGQFIYNSSKCG